MQPGGRAEGEGCGRGEQGEAHGRRCFGHRAQRPGRHGLPVGLRRQGPSRGLVEAGEAGAQGTSQAGQDGAGRARPRRISTEVSSEKQQSPQIRGIDLHYGTFQKLRLTHR